MLRSEVYFLSINSFQTLTFYPIYNVYIIYLQTSKQLSFKLKHRNEIVETRITKYCNKSRTCSFIRIPSMKEAALDTWLIPLFYNTNNNQFYHFNNNKRLRTDYIISQMTMDLFLLRLLPDLTTGNMAVY
jgi:hypothetical protein